MKKKKLIIIVVLMLIIVGIAGLFIYKQVELNDRKYEVEKINKSEYNYFIIRENEKYGVINKSGDTVVNAEYTNIIIPNPKYAVFICYNGDNTKVLNQNQEDIYSQYQNVKPIRLKNISSDLMYEKNSLTYEKDGKIGIINLEGKTIAKPIYESVEAFPYKEGEILIKLDGKYGVINNKGKYLVKAEYDQITVDGYTTEENGYKNAGYIISKTTDDGYRYGYMNVDGKIILKPEYNDVSRIVDIKDNNNIYLVVAQNGQYGLFKNSEQIINNEYQSISYNSENEKLIVEKTKKFGVATINGEIIIPIEYKQIDSVGEYMYAKDSDDKIQVYKTDGTEVQNNDNIYITNTDNGNYKIKIDNSTEESIYSITDKDGREITKNKYSYVEYLYDNYFIVSVTGGKVGVIDDKENQIIEIKYDSIDKIKGTECISTGLSEDKTTQLYNKKLEKICELKDAIINSEEGYIKIYNDNETKYFDNNGEEKENKEILPNNKIYAKEKDGKWGFVDSNGNKVVDYIYEKTTDLNEYGYAGIKLDGKWGIVDSNGKVIKQPTYEFNNKAEPQFIKQYYKIEYGYGEFYYTDKI